VGLSNRLGDLGRREEALTAIEQAAGIYRQLAEARPDAFLPTSPRRYATLPTRCPCSTEMQRHRRSVTKLLQSLA
jgi:hypothetical protein